jgi:hypothetical protein
MNLAQFCQKISSCEDLSSANKALAILWFESRDDHNVAKSSNQLASAIREHRLGNPNSTQLTSQIKKLRHTVSKNGQFVLKASSRDKVESWVSSAIKSVMAVVPEDDGYVPAALWIETRGYIEKVFRQLNGCVHYGFLDAASVMLRRVTETLIIECYEHLGRDGEIRDNSGNPYMLGELVTRCTANSGIKLGRDAKRALKDIKELGDRSAHNRRFNAVYNDFESIRSGVRVAIDEMIQLASLKRAAKITKK